MGQHYFFAHDERQSGPFSATEMRGLAGAGQILLTDFVWQGDLGQRVVAAKVKNLFAGQQAQAPRVELAVPALHSETGPRQLAAPETGTANPIAVAPAVAEPPQPPPTPEPARKPPPPRQKRVISIKGGTLMGQDGLEVKYKRKWAECGHEDPSRSTAKIVVGSMRLPYFCPKCKRMRMVEMMGVN